MNSVYNIFEQYEMNLVVTIIAIRISGHTAFDYGWHAVNLVPRDGCEPITTLQLAEKLQRTVEDRSLH